MKYINNYNKYHTGNPFEDNFLNEGKGIPHTLKWIVDEIFYNIDDFKNQIFNFDETDFKVSLTISYYNKKLSDIYGISTFGIYSPLNGLSNSTIKIFLNFNDYDEKDLKRVILHELLHIYEIYQRCESGIKKDLNWFVNNELLKIRNKYSHDKFLSDLIFIMYLSYNHEINARVSEVYSILIDLRTDDKNVLLNELYKTNAWKRLLDIKNFKISDYDINYDICFNFFKEFNTKIQPKLKQEFNIFKIPETNKDIDIILKNYMIFFRKQSKKFENKLYKIIQEIIFDIKKIYNT